MERCEARKNEYAVTGGGQCTCVSRAYRSGLHLCLTHRNLFDEICDNDGEDAAVERMLMGRSYHSVVSA